VKYDGIWITGLHGDAWPRPVAIDPFIPLAAQRQAGIPSVSAARMLEQARALLNAWQRSAHQLVVSWPRHDGDREHLPSPLLDELAQAQNSRGKPAAPSSVARVEAPPRTRRGRHSIESLAQMSFELAVESPEETTATSLAEYIRGARRVETYEDAVGEPWPVSKLVPAGVRTLEFQNRCPVLAYASFRLGAMPLETPQPGVDYRDRGMLVHSALEILWKQIGDSEQLHALKGPQLDSMIDESVTQAMADAFAVGGIYQEQRSTIREHRRTARLIRRLCDAELQRPPFSVSELEAERRWTSAAGTSMRLRIDRIDQLEDGTFAIFDYKSGAAQAQDWTSERVSHPQLLVYLLASGVNVSTIATAQLTPLRVGFKGIADRKGRLPRVPGLEADEGASGQRWQEQTVRWRGTIERLAADFVAGAATLDPMQNACRICHLHAFCRIADAPGDDDDVAEE
jgi:RecB family exonuclease